MRLDKTKVLRSRERLGYTMRDVAAQSGLTENTVVRAEHDRDIRPTSARKLAAALGVTVADLYREPY